MDRPLPTDPPDEPVNRIKEFFPQEWTKQAPPNIFSDDSAQLILTSDFPVEDRTKEAANLLALSKKYEKDPHNFEVALRIALAYQRLGSLSEALQYFEWCLQLCPRGSVALNRIIELLKKAIGDKSSGAPDPKKE
ncbi:MAG TPA: tetratricopeptide repeat protein [Verrucomicrobiaceae bacterium]|jgi:tetratricopeptide (TPR) repeat protein